MWNKAIIFPVAACMFLMSCGPSLKERKEEADIHYRTGEVQFAEKNYSVALEELMKAVKLNPLDASYRNTLGLAYFAKKMYLEALKEFNEAVRLSPDYSEAHLNAGAVASELKDFDTAIAHFKAAAGNILYKTPEYAWNNLGWAYYNKGMYANAVESYKKAVEAVPDYQMAYYNMGLAYDKMNKADEASQAFKKTVELAPNFADAHYQLGLVSIRRKDKFTARQSFERVMELVPQSDKARSAKEYLDLLK